MAGGATGGAIEGGHTLCSSTERRTKNGAAGGETNRLDLGGDVAELLVVHPMLDHKSDPLKLYSVLATAQNSHAKGSKRIIYFIR